MARRGQENNDVAHRTAIEIKLITKETRRRRKERRKQQRSKR